jgi:hypothetical protein
VTGVAAPVPADPVFLKELIEAGTLRNVIGPTYALSEIADAHRYAQSGHKVGNIAVVVSDQALQAIFRVREPWWRNVSTRRRESSRAIGS